MYQVALQRSFIAQHFLIGGDWGAENQLHSHHFKLEVKLTAQSLDRHEYAFDISILETVLDDVQSRYQDKTLNSLEEFNDKNPSVELFCKNIWQMIAPQFAPESIRSLAVTLWEDESAWASYENSLN